MRDMTIGQYYPGHSLIHRLDPRVKLLSTLLYIISVFLIAGPLSLILATGLLILVIVISGIPFGKLLKGLRAILVILIMTVIFSLVFTPGEEIWHLAFIHVTREGAVNGAYVAMRLCYLIIGSSVMTLTTTPNALTDGLEKGLHFLNALHVPVHEIAMMMSIALRFIPILMEELDRIMMAQKARGADFDSGSLIKRAQGLIPLIVPLFVSAIRRADDLALAMDARCYHGSEGRTRMKPLRYEKRDRLAYLVMLLYMAAMIAMKLWL